ncbi:MAG: hypothetical protein JO028_04010, partial [Acidobacteriaceae bacterium]|nr:hypothetical protein [Acidobacteriaceae bacterium]
PDPVAQRLLLTAQAEVAEARALKNLRLHERRLQRQYEKDKAELNDMVHKRWEREERQREAKAQRRQEAAAQQRRREQAQKRAERKKAKEVATNLPQPESIGEPELTPNGFEFATALETSEPTLTLSNPEE